MVSTHSRDLEDSRLFLAPITVADGSFQARNRSRSAPPSPRRHPLPPPPPLPRKTVLRLMSSQLRHLFYSSQ